MEILVVHRSLWHEKGKLALSVLGVAASLSLIALLNGFRDGMYSVVSLYTDRMNADLIITQSGGKGNLVTSAIPAAMHGEIASVSGAAEIEHVLATDIIFPYGDIKAAATLIGYDPETGVGGPWKLAEGRENWDSGEITLDLWLARRAKLGIGDQIQVLGRSFTIVGLTRETSSVTGVYLFTSRDAVERLLQLAGIASFYWLRLPPGTDVEVAARAIEDQIPGVEALTPAQVSASQRQTLASLLDAPINTILFIGLVVGIAVMGLTAYTAIIDRVREYGVLKAIGASDRWLRRLVVMETVYRAGLGLVLGIGQSYLAAALIMRAFPQFTITLCVEALAAMALAALVMTLLAALLPVRRVAAIDPAIAFKA